MKKILSLFLTVAMIFSLIPVVDTAVKADDDNSSTTDIVVHVDTWQEMMQYLEQAYDNMYIRGLTVVLDEDITVDKDNYEAFNDEYMIEMNGDKLYVIDLNGHNINVQPGYGKAKILFYMTDGAGLRIVDTKGHGEIYFDIDFEEYGDMIYVEDGSFCNYNCTLRMNNSPGSDLIYAANNAKVILKGGSLINESDQSYGIWARGNAKVTIGAGSIKTDSYCVHVEKRENLKIYGGWFELTGSWTNYPRIDVEDTNNKQDALKLYLAEDRNVYRYINWSNEDAPDLYNKAIDDVAENFGVCIDKTSTSYKHYCAWTPELKIEGTSVMVCDHFNEFIRMKRPEGTGKYKNIDLEITSIRPDSGLPVGQSPKSPDGCFDVKCKDSNAYQWEISGSEYVSYWADSSDNKLTATHIVSGSSSYILHLRVSPVNNVMVEDDVDIDDVKQITLNGVPIAMGQYVRGELGTGINITVELYPVNIVTPNENQTFFCLREQKVNVSAEKIEGKHFTEWGGTYHTGAGTQSLTFDDPYAENGSFTVPYSDFAVSAQANYEDHTTVVIPAVPATCTEDGWTEGLICSVCDEVIVPQEKISALGHQFNGKTCTVCGAVNPDYVEPTTEESTTEESTTKEPATEEPTTKEPTTEESTTKEPATEESTTKEPATEEPTTEESTTKEPATEEPTTEESTTKEPTTDEPATKEPATNEPTTKQPTTKEPATNGSEQSKTLTVGGIVYEQIADGEYFSAKAKKPSIKKITRGKKSIKMTWKTVSGVSGYVIQYSTSNKFTKKKTKNVIIKGNKSKTFKKTIKKLKAKKKYCVRVRAYMIVDMNGKYVKAYSGWSKAKKVKTK